MKKFLSVVLAMIMVLSIMPYASFSGEVDALYYSFTGVNKDDAGYAEGSITFTALQEGTNTYYMYWGDDSKALPQYFEIASFTLEYGNKYTYKFPAQTAIPVDAECVFVTTEADGNKATVAGAVASEQIPDSKKLYDSSQQRQYRYAAFSDIHIDMQHGQTAGFYVNSQKHWAQTLDACVDRNADFIITAGDDVTNADGATLEYLTYQKILADSDYVNPIYEASGNHEPRGSYNHGCDSSCADEEFAIGTGINGNTDDINAAKQYYEITEPKTGDHFIFMGEVHAHPGENDNFSKEQLDWLEGLLNKYKGDGKKVFLIQHALIQGYGAGDDTFDPGYQGGIRMSVTDEETGVTTQFPNNQRFKAILEANKEIIWYSGHTHLDFRFEQNYSSENGTSCHMVHIPSACNTTAYYTDENGVKYLGTSTDYTFYEDTTQGYFVDVFEDATILYGTNLHYNKVYPRYTYIIEEKEPDVRPTEATQPRPTQPAPTAPDIENGKTIYFVNSANWDEVYVYSWVTGTTTSTWPGYPMTKTGETVNGFDVYAVEIEADHDAVIFNNNDNGSQTADLVAQENQYYDVKSKAWYTSLSDVPAVAALSTDRYLVGEFNGWSTVADEFMLKNETDRVGYITLNLAANTTYQFKVVREGTWTSNATPITADATGLTFSKSVSGNATLTTTYAGEYVFSFGLDTSQLSVTYPKGEAVAQLSVEPAEEQVENIAQLSTTEFVYGDTDIDGEVNIIDATFIQRHLAKLTVLNDEQLKRAMVSGGDEINIIDATYIQRKLAKLITKFPVEEIIPTETTPTETEKPTEKPTDPVGPSPNATVTKAKDYLDAYYQYASYDEYQGLKKAYYTVMTTVPPSLHDWSSQQIEPLQEAITAFDTLRSKVHVQTVYFTDGESFGNIRAYSWNGATTAEVEAWPGQKASFIETNAYGQRVYAVTINYSKYDHIVFNGNNSNKTVDIALDGKSGTQYYPTTQDTQGAWGVDSTTFLKMWY